PTGSDTGGIDPQSQRGASGERRAPSTAGRRGLLGGSLKPGDCHPVIETCTARPTRPKGCVTDDVGKELEPCGGLLMPVVADGENNHETHAGPGTRGVRVVPEAPSGGGA